MKVGTDGVLLGSWVDLTGASAILDIGTGTGLLSLMMGQRSKKAYIDAVEIDANAYKQAGRNVEDSPWNERIRVIHSSFQKFSSVKTKYDLLITNPPFFSNAMKANGIGRTAARHSLLLSQKDILEGALKLLKPEGKLAVIFPRVEFESFYFMCSNAGLFCNRLLRVMPTPRKPAHRILAEFSYEDFRKNDEELIIEKYGRHKYSEEYIRLTKDFYLNF